MSMILYNLRYRGPFEYDKLVLNAFQLSNEADRLIKGLEDNEFKRIVETEEYMDRLISDITEEKGILENLCRERFLRG